MLRAVLLAFALIFTTAAISPAKAGFVTGLQLLDSCGEEADDFLGGICYGFIMGIADAGDREGGGCSRHEGSRWTWRTPDDVKVRQVNRVVVKWLNEHPEKLHFGAAGLVAEALAEAFPCR